MGSMILLVGAVSYSIKRYLYISRLTDGNVGLSFGSADSTAVFRRKSKEV